MREKRKDETRNKIGPKIRIKPKARKTKKNKLYIMSSRKCYDM